jgi:16S rRNA processing protein RimM
MGSKSSTSNSSPPTSGSETARVTQGSDWVMVGRVRRAHGLKGELAVEVLSDVAGRWTPGARLDAVDRQGTRRVVSVVAARPHQDHLLVTLAEVRDRNAAEAMVGASFEVERAAVPPAPTGSFYQFELVGCEVRDRKQGELGRVTDLLAGPGGWLLRLEGPQGELLIPFVESFLGRVDVEAQRIEVELPEGFVEACGSKL